MFKSVISKGSDGEIQITFTIPYPEIKKAQDETVAEMAKDIEVPGFRKGKAPLEKVREKIKDSTLIEHSLGHILPHALSESIKEHKLKLGIYPKYELISSKEGEDWQVRAVSCELPEITLGNYKDIVAGEVRAASLKRQLTKEEKEQVIIKTLIEKIKLVIPRVLIEEEVNNRLSSLLSRIEKLGLPLESYLASIGKTPESLRTEYEAQARDAISIDLTLSKIAEEENLKVSEKEVTEALKVSDSEDGERNRHLVEAVLRKREALKFLSDLS